MSRFPKREGKGVILHINCCFCNGGSKPRGESKHTCSVCQGAGTIPVDVPGKELLASTDICTCRL